MGNDSPLNDSTSPTQIIEANEKGDERLGSALSGASGPARMEVSAQTIARMMGIASATDLQLLEGRLDLLTTKVSALMMKVDKIMTGLSTVASAGDIGRLETQIAAVKAMVREAVEAIGTLKTGPSAPSKEAAESQSRKLREGIRSSSES